MDSIKIFYSMIRNDKRKERFEMILEPMQAIIQLTILAFCPQGSKLTISSNLLGIQNTNWTQFMERSYNNDRRDDLVYLFSVITRFYKFYYFMKEGDNELNILFNLLVQLSMKGIDRLTQTYSACGDSALLQTLKMYKSMMENGEDFCIDKNPNLQSGIREDIDEIFIQIRELYTHDHFIIILHTIQLMQANPDDYKSYKSSLEYVLKPICNQIQEWIQQNIAY